MQLQLKLRRLSLLLLGLAIAAGGELFYDNGKGFGTVQAAAAVYAADSGAAAAFNDIQGHWAEKEIKALSDKQFLDGYKNTQDGSLSFKPNQNITRAEFVRYFVKSKGLPLSNNTESEFTDLGDSSQEDRGYIITAVEYGLINGYPDHTFRPDSTITRAEIAAILSRSEMLPPAEDASFADIPEDYWASDAIFAVQQAGLFDGYEDGSFRPDQKMTRGEAAAVIYRLIDASAS